MKEEICPKKLVVKSVESLQQFMRTAFMNARIVNVRPFIGGLLMSQRATEKERPVLIVSELHFNDSLKYQM